MTQNKENPALSQLLSTPPIVDQRVPSPFKWFDKVFSASIKLQPLILNVVTAIVWRPLVSKHQLSTCVVAETNNIARRLVVLVYVLCCSVRSA